MDLDKIIQTVKPNLKASSRKHYSQNIMKLHDLIKHTRIMGDLRWLDDYDSVKEALDKMKESTKRNYLNSIIVVLQYGKDFKTDENWKRYTKERNELNTKFTKANGTNTKTEKQEKNWLTPEEFDSVIRKYKSYITNHKILQKSSGDLDKSDRQKLMEYLLIKFYKDIPSRNDFHSLKIVSKKEYNQSHSPNQNYLVLERNNIHIVVHVWKTKNESQGRISRVIKLTPELQTLVRAYRRKLPDREYVFVSPKELPLTRNSLTKLLTKIFKVFYPEKNISSNMLRHIYLSHKYADTVKDMKEDETKLGHGSTTQKTYIKTD